MIRIPRSRADWATFVLRTPVFALGAARRAHHVTALRVLLAALVLGATGCGERATAPARTIALTECQLPHLPIAAQCGTLAVPEDRSQPDGRKISLVVAILPANTLTPKRDPLFILAGGPGQAATSLAPFAAQLVGVRKDRDIVLIDQRGTGRSSPLDCAAWKPDDGIEAALELDPVPKARACAAELAARGVDPAQYTTAAFVADLDAMRIALGYDRINLWGGSYGTRAALEYLRAHPAKVRSVVLDGVVPPRMRIALDVWPAREAALAAVIEGCAASAACNAAHPALGRTLAAIDADLGPAGREMALADPRTGATQKVVLSFDHVLAALQPLLYVPELQSLLPEVIGRAAQQDYGPLLATASLLTADVADQINTALHYSVACAEDAPRLATGDVERALANLRTHTLALHVVAVCSVWPKGTASVEATTPVTSAVPVLILSGALDPVTPPANGEEVARTLSNSKHIVARGYGHIVSPHGCAPRLIAAFVDDLDFAKLPANCLEHFEKSVRPPLWPDRLGPQS
jgi:pimeloyl-ACP methyl ester carboxylesterase